MGWRTDGTAASPCPTLTIGSSPTSVANATPASIVLIGPQGTPAAISSRNHSILVRVRSRSTRSSRSWSRFGRNEDRTANRDQLRPLLVERLRTRTKMEWFRELIAAGVACGPINTIDQGVAFATEVGLDPVVSVGQGDAALPSVRHPITFSQTPAGYRRLPWTSTAPRSANGWPNQKN